ncbi:MAG: hypothetical protein FWH18_08965 [Marinilabiliaceae bacterium]|nr:hypothetical protein [Marinilabiliaceae bacterium]
MGETQRVITRRNKSSNRIQVQSNVLETAYPNSTKNVVAFEKSIRNNSFETLAVFDKDGNILLQNRGNETEAEAHATVNVENGILTHNHPNGGSFSDIDIQSALHFNQAEVRVVTDTYTYSMKRPYDGWGVSNRKMIREYKKELKKVSSEYSKRVKEGKITSEEASIDTTHVVMKNLSKKYVWNYTRKIN